jgi:hypothetical protein
MALNEGFKGLLVTLLRYANQLALIYSRGNSRLVMYLPRLGVLGLGGLLVFHLCDAWHRYLVSWHFCYRFVRVLRTFHFVHLQIMLASVLTLME